MANDVQKSRGIVIAILVIGAMVPLSFAGLLKASVFNHRDADNKIPEVKGNIMKTLFGILSLVVVASLLAVPVMAQTPNPTPGPPPGMYLYWDIAMHSPTAHSGVGTAQYEII